jgi:peptide/nickel transport system permease protein
MLSLLNRLLGSALVLFVVSVVLFTLVHAVPVSPALVVLGADASADDLAEFDHDHGLDRPLIAQYLGWAGAALRGEFGQSMVDDQSISRTIAQTLPVTLELVVAAFAIAVALAIPLGVLSAFYENGWIDHLARGVATLGVSIPGFWLGLMLIAWVSVGLGWLPAGGYVPWRDGIAPHVASLALPALALGIYYIAIISRMTRASVADVLLADHVRVARAMGLPRRRILVYVLRCALAPVVTVAAMSFGYMFGWALIIEQVFNIAGMSRALLNGILRRDYLLIEDVVLIFTAIFLAANLVADVLYRVLDPRLGS